MENKHGAAAMIDLADNQTQTLPLEQPKRGRGRPATGKAMSPAEKQKAYRERQATQQKTQEPAVLLDKMRSTTSEYLEKLEQQLTAAKKETAAAISRAEEAEANFVTLRKKLDKALATIQELKKGNVTEIKSLWDIESRKTGKRTWEKVAGYAWTDRNAAEKFIQEATQSGSTLNYRVVPVKVPK